MSKRERKPESQWELEAMDEKVRRLPPGEQEQLRKYVNHKLEKEIRKCQT